MKTLIKHLQPAIVKSMAASYVVVASASPINGVASAAPMTMDEALDSITNSIQPEPDSPDPPITTLTAGAQATLDTLAKAEGTWDDSTQSILYDMRFADAPGRGSLDTTRPHPRTVKGSRYGSGYRSDASGAFQFLSTTWIGIHRGINQAMTPNNQDKAALHLVKSTGYNVDRPFRHQAHLLASTWASIPNRYNVSTYGQPVKSLAMLSRFHQQRKIVYENIAKAEPIEVSCYIEQNIIKSSFA